MVRDLTTPGTQDEFGALVGITQQAVSALAQRGILPDGATLDEWLLSYCEHLRMIAAGRGGDGGLELAAERAALARAQRDKVEMQNAVTRRELAPVRLLSELLAATASRAARILETIPGAIKRRLPEATNDDIAAIAEIVAKARNNIAKLDRKDLFDAAIRSDDDDRDEDQLQDAA